MATVEIQLRDDGVLSVDEAMILTFPDGLIGCDQWRRFALVQLEDSDALAVLQCLDDEGACFVVADPTWLWPDYQPAVDREQLARIGATATTDLEVLCTVRAHDDGTVTANLLGPLLVNPVNRLGIQAVQYDSDYTTAQAVPAARATELQKVLL